MISLRKMNKKVCFVQKAKTAPNFRVNANSVYLRLCGITFYKIYKHFFKSMSN